MTTSRTTAAKERRSWLLIGWAALLAVLGAAAFVLGFAGPFAGASWTAVLSSLGAGVALAALIFLGLGLFAVRLGPRETPLTDNQRLVVRAAAGMVLADSDATHVEIEALRVWIQRNFGHVLLFDELRALAQESAGNRDAIVTAVADAHRGKPSWGKDMDDALISAAGSVIVADLRNRDEELAYLRKLAEAVEFDAKRCESLVAKLKALELELESLVVEALAARKFRESAA